LDELTATRMREELLDLWHELGCTVVFVTHNPLEAAFLADRIVVMSPGPGRIVEQLQVTGRLPRPRDADDPALWDVSREAVRLVRGQDGARSAVKELQGAGRPRPDRRRAGGQQALRAHAGPRRREPAGGAWRALRPPGAQRRREDHAHPH